MNVTDNPNQNYTTCHREFCVVLRSFVRILLRRVVVVLWRQVGWACQQRWQMLAQPGKSFHLSLERKELSQRRGVKKKKGFCATHTKQNVDKLVQLDFFGFFFYRFISWDFGRNKRRSVALSVANGYLPDNWHNLNEMLECCEKKSQSHSSYTANLYDSRNNTWNVIQFAVWTEGTEPHQCTSWRRKNPFHFWVHQ